MTICLKRFCLRQAGGKRALNTDTHERINPRNANPTDLDAPAETDRKKDGLPHAETAVKELAIDEPPSA